MQTSILYKAAGRPSTMPRVINSLRRISAAVRVPLTVTAAVSGAWLFIQCMAGISSVTVAVTACASVLAAAFLPSSPAKEGGEA